MSKDAGVTYQYGTAVVLSVYAAPSSSSQSTTSASAKQ
jgi:hypothetical protein